ncbi:tyrosine-type recombinase/integrase, partial [Huintestinicola sp.]|uniref:tyrosine-type recombinase/integrase n=1 Tax=Huintestinicola sp. TaxID=2981661 RepID=UPI003D7CEA78
RKPPKDNDYLLRSAVGGPAEPKTMQETFKRILKAAGVADANFHSLRHTFATRAIEKGADVKTLSVLLGHSDVNIALNRYAHVLDEQKRKTMNLLLGE